MKTFDIVPFSDETQFIRILPQFPNWEKSFVSGPASPLFEITHSVHAENAQLIRSVVTFKGAALGPPGHVHGGATAGLIDEVMGICVWHQKIKSVTQNLEIAYLKPLSLKESAIVFTQLQMLHERNVEVLTTIYDKKKIPRVVARGIFHRLTAEQLSKFKA